MAGKLKGLFEDASQGLLHIAEHANGKVNGNGTAKVPASGYGPAIGAPAASPAVIEEPIKPAPEPDLKTKLAAVAQVISKSLADLPKNPHAQPAGAAAAEPTGLLRDVQEMGFEDVDTLLDFLHAGVHGVVDDADLLLERLVTLLAKLPATSAHGQSISSGLIHQLWSALDHPVLSTLDDKYKYREADGSNNCMHMPMMGAAGTAYARTTRPETVQRPDVPEPSVLFDTLMARGDEFEEHPNRISSVLFYLATIITHDIFQSVSP